MAYVSKKEDESGLSSYYNNKTTIIRVFNDSSISLRKCRALLARIVYLLYIGETFSAQEATTLFFGTTKLFQHKDSALRQMVYLAIKELATIAEDVIMVIYRPNAIRALCRIINPSMAQVVEHFFKTMIVDRTPSISSAALVSSYHLFPLAKDVVKRWVNEAQEAVSMKSSSSFFPGSSATSYITQYHALQLGGGKSGAGTTLKNSMALCMLIRYAAKMMEEDPNIQRQILDLLEEWLRHKSDMVNFEAARAICEMKNVNASQLTRPIAVLQLFLSSPKPAYAITTLLKTGNEASVDCLMKHITVMNSKSIVDAIHSLCIKFPTKHVSMLTFLSGVLRDEGRYDFKRAVMEAMFDMIKASTLASVRDCEFTKLSVRILHLLGLEGPKALQPTKYIRFIYNCVVLENATVRAAAVTSLAKFGMRSIDILLNRCLDDVDDEVRDHTAMYLRVMKETSLADTYVKEESVFSLAALESKLVAYVNDVDASAQPFDASSIPKISRAQLAAESTRPSTLDTITAPATRTSVSPPPLTAAETQSAYVQQLADIPHFAEYGTVLNSSVKPAQLTESETEYQVTCVKHIFKEHIVFQFNVSNTLPDTVLEQMVVVMQPQADSGLTEDVVFQIDSLSCANSPGIVYVSFKRDNPQEYTTTSFQCILKFIPKELDPSTGRPEEEGYEDEYQLEEVELSAGGDHIIPSYASFSSEWDRLRSGATATETFSLGAMQSIKAACDSITELLNMEPLGGTKAPSSTSVHMLQLSGLVTGGVGKVLVRCRMAFSRGQGVALELGVRAEQENACALVVSVIGG
ncbi:coatomer subunit gamma [Suillus variegatus]|nr:coatomer subunit gamma [Suillus variegatus]